jgi:hypothetical protein
VARLAAYGQTLDARCYHPQLADFIALARGAAATIGPARSVLPNNNSGN